MNARVQSVGTTILSIVFMIAVIVSWVASPLVMLIGAYSVAGSPNGSWWLLALVMAVWLLPIFMAVAGLYLWQTRFPWLAVVPVLIVGAPMWVAGSLVFGWRW
ncbi:hypothetical protein [Reyranella sp.]|uniref:hypothetical protein n=1 Tax=Reyranella sp. TaxID=1929291 RepID=UPI003C7E4F65